MSDKPLCPCCGRPMDDVGPQALLSIELARLPSILLGSLVAAYPKAQTIEQLADAMWWDTPKGPPADPANNISIYVRRMNPILRAYGWEIRGPQTGGPPRGRRLYRVGE